MVKETLLDTDTLSFYFRGELEVVDKFRKYINKFEQVNISIITYYEIVGGLKFKQANKQLQEFEDFVENNNLLIYFQGIFQVIWRNLCQPPEEWDYNWQF